MKKTLQFILVFIISVGMFIVPSNVVKAEKNEKAKVENLERNDKSSIELLGHEWQIHSKLDENRVVDNGNFTGATYTKLNPIDGTDTQKWSFEYSSKRGAYVLRNKYWKRTLKCDLDTGEIYLLPYLEDNDDSNHLILENMDNGEYIFKNYKNPNMVLDLYGSNANNGSNIQVHERKNTDNQKFKLIR